MKRPRKPRKPAHLSVMQRLACVVVVAAPPLVLLGRIGFGLLDYFDAILAQSAPLASAFASASVGREVRIERLSPFLSTRELWNYYRRVGTLGTIPIVADNITIANGAKYETSGELAFIRQVRADVSVPALLSGRENAAITRIEIRSPRLLLVRRVDGSLNVQELVKEDAKSGGKPFLTTIDLQDAAIRLVDRATPLRGEQVNVLYPVNATAILGASRLAFDAALTPKAGTVTAKRLRGAVRLSGTVAQGRPGSRPDAALPTDPAYTLRVALPDAEIPYFVAYLFGRVPNVRLDDGRAEALSATLVSANVAQTRAADAVKKRNPKAKGAEPPAPSVLLSTKLRGVGGRVEGLPTDLQGFGGDVRFVSEGDLVSFDLAGSVFAAPLSLRGTVWNVTKPAPNLAVRFDAPTIPLSRMLTAFKTTLPPGITLSGNAGASGFITGTSENLSGTADVFVPQATWQNKATVRNIAARLTVAGGVLQARQVTAQSDLSGALSGSGSVRFGEIVSGKNGDTLQLLPANRIAADFSVAASRVSLPRAATLAGNAAPANLRLTGTANVAATGGLRGGKLFLTADTQTQGLTVGGIPFTVAQARVLVRDNAVVVPQIALQSPGIGSLIVAGDSSLSGSAPLSLRFAANALDVGKLAGALGVRNVGGVLNATGMVGGTLENPRLTLTRFAVLNPRYDKYRLQSVTGANIVATKSGVTIPATSPVVARRLPALVTVSGRITDFLPATANAKRGAQTRLRPRLALEATVTDVDYSTVAPFLPPPEPGSSPLAGTLTFARASITGFADAPRVAGLAQVRRVIVADYPIESASAQFVYDAGAVRVPSLLITSSAGSVTAQGTVSRSGEVTGSFLAPAIDLSRLSYLTQDTASLSGVARVRGTFSGTRDRPVVTASLDAPEIAVAGTTINNLEATNIRYIANLSQNVQRVEIPRVSLQQAGGTGLLLENGQYDFKRKTFGGTVELRSGSVGDFLANLRRSPFAQTPNGKSVLGAIRGLPSPLDGAFPGARTDASGKTVRTNRVTVAGIAGEKGVGNYRVSGEVYAQNLRAGRYGAETLLISLGRGGNAQVPFGQPNLSVDAQGTNISIDGRIPSNLTLKGSLVGETATVTELTLANRVIAITDEEAKIRDAAIVALTRVSEALTPGTGSVVVAAPNAESGTAPKTYFARLTASGTAGLGDGGRINAQVDANAVDFDLLRPFVPTLPLEGTFDVTAFATGLTRTPELQASVGAQDVAVVPRTPAGQVEGQPTGETVVPATPERVGFNAVARVRSEEGGKRFLELSSVQLTRRGGGQLFADAKLPFSYDSPYILPNEPIAATLTFPDFPLETLNAVTATDTDTQKKGKRQKKDEATGLRFFGGDIKGQVTLAGTLREPDLSGGITLTDGSFSLPKVGGRETFNRIKDWDAQIALAGSRVNVDSTIALAKPDGTGDNGKLTVSGEAVVQELETALDSLGRLGRPAPVANGAKPAGSGTTISRLSATFDAVQISEENLLYLIPDAKLTPAQQRARKPANEQFRAQIVGTLNASGNIAAPLIATPAGQPLVVTKTRIVPPGTASSNDQPTVPVDSGPRFNIEIDAPGKNNISIPLVASVDVSGSATITGNAGRPAVRGRFVTEGGVLQYYIGRFTVDKGGAATLNFVADRGDVTFDNVVARTTAYLRPGASLSGVTQRRGEPPIAASQPGLDGAGTRYKITARLDTKLFFGVGEEDRNGSFKLNMTSDPALAPAQIYALLVPQATLADAASGDLTKAGRELLTTALQQSVLPGLFAPLEQGLANTFGLEQFSLDYSPSSPLNITLLKRLPDPLQRFVVQYTRSLQTNSRTNTQPPYTVGLLYELYELRTKPGQPIPRLQFGFFTDEQRTFSGSLRATILY
ncbi:MAG: translocation/assembly module TamB domain-containing protein [Armatimonadetes bacterium]|nr:translocation/assembly module TamB domain-containing protein [Armatimonadota bacterium]